MIRAHVLSNCNPKFWRFNRFSKMENRSKRVKDLNDDLRNFIKAGSIIPSLKSAIDEGRSS